MGQKVANRGTFKLLGQYKARGGLGARGKKFNSVRVETSRLLAESSRMGKPKQGL